MKDVLGDERREYQARSLQRSDLAVDPQVQFSGWLHEALAAGLVDATAMTLATASADGLPNARIVLLKHHDADGYVFYTDYGSQKGADLAQNPQAELLFYWRELERQVRIQGGVVKLSAAQSTAYFSSRPRESQISALASNQSEVVASREILEQRAAELRDQEDLLPPDAKWGGYCLVPHRYEFWQGRENRLHDRFRYRLAGEKWLIERLQP